MNVQRLLRFFLVILVSGFLSLLTKHSDAEEVRIRYGGLTLNGILSLAKAKTFNDGIVLMVHGTLAHNGMDTIKNLAAVLNERGLSTLAINLSLGINNRLGMYDCKIPHRHKHQDALDEIAAWLDWLDSRGASNIILFGHSRGGNQVARFTAERGHPNLSHLVLMAPSLGNPRKESYKKIHHQPLGEILTRAEALVKSRRGEEMLQGVGLLYCKNVNVTAHSFISYYKHDPGSETVKVLPKLKIPTLVVAGSNDSVVKDLQSQIKPIADGRKIIFTVVEDADHFFLDLFAEDVADKIEAFISSGS